MPGKKILLFVISRGEVIRNFVYSDIAKQLKKDYHLIFFSVFPNATLQSYLKDNCDELHELEALQLNYAQRLLHEIIDLAHNRYLWSEAAKVRWNMRDAEATSFFEKFTRAIKKLVVLPLANNRALSLLEKLDLKLAANNKQVKSYRDKIKKIAPDLVFNGSHSHSKIAYPLLQAARLQKIKTAAFLFSWDNLTSQGRVFPPHDYYFAWNDKIRQDLMNIYPSTNKAHTFVSGTPQFSFHFDPKNFKPRLEFLQELGLAEKDRFILYSAGMSNHMPFEPEVAERIADIIYKTYDDIKLVIRTYAKDRYKVFEPLKKRRKDILFPEVKWEENFQTPLLEDQVFFTNLLYHCELGINVASTISLELCMFDKPAINVGYNPPGRDIYPYDYTRFYSFDHYKPIVDSSAVKVVASEVEMETAIATYLAYPTTDSTSRKKLIDDFFELDANGDAMEQIFIRPIKIIVTQINSIINP